MELFHPFQDLISKNPLNTWRSYDPTISKWFSDTGNGIILPIFTYQIKKLLLEHDVCLILLFQNMFQNKEMEFSTVNGIFTHVLSSDQNKSLETVCSFDPRFQKQFLIGIIS